MARSRALPKDRDLRKLIETELDPRYQLERDGAGHLRVVLADTGEPFRTNNDKIVTVPNTPSDHRAVANLRATLKAAGLLVKKAAPTRSTREHDEREDLRVDRGSLQEQAKERQVKTDALRKDMEPWVKKLGGWEMRGLKSDIAAILYDTNPGKWPTFSAVTQLVTTFVAGNAIGDENRGALHALNEMYQAAEDVRGLHVDLLRKAKGLEPSLGPVVLKEGEEWPYEIKLIPLESLFADFSYQRPVHEPFVRQLVMTFDERLVGVVDVSARKDGTFAIMDGQQRTEAMRQAGKTKAYCATYEGMTPSDEAQFFFHKNQDRKGMSAFYGFRARVLAGDEKAIAIEKTLAEHGYKLGPVADQNTIIGSVAAVEKTYDLQSDVRDNCLAPALKVMDKAFRGRKGSVDTEIIRGLGRFFRVFADDEIQWDHWIEALTALGPMLVIGRARDFSTASEHRYHGKSMAMTLVDIHNTGLGSKARLPLKRIEADDESRRKRGIASTLAA